MDMRKHILVLALVLGQMPVLFAQENEPVVDPASTALAADSASQVALTKTLPQSADTLSNSLRGVLDSTAKSASGSAQAVVTTDTTSGNVDPKLAEDSLMRLSNGTDEMVQAKPLPEVRFVTIGVTGGIGSSWYRSDPSNNMMAFCFRAGLNFDIPFGQYFSFQPELLFATRGGGYKAEGNHAEHLYYMDVPLNVKLSKRMNLSKTMTGRPFVSLGPVLSLGMYGTSKCNGHTSHPMQNDADDEMKDAFYDNFDFSLNLRVGYDFDKHYSVALGYQFGLTDIANDDLTKDEKVAYGEEYGCLPEVHNNSLYITIGYNW